MVQGRGDDSREEVGMILVDSREEFGLIQGRGRDDSRKRLK